MNTRTHIYDVVSARVKRKRDFGSFKTISLEIRGTDENELPIEILLIGDERFEIVDAADWSIAPPNPIQEQE